MITTHVEGAVYKIVISRPDKLNALNVLMTRAIADAIRLAEVESVGSILLSSEGTDFSAGADVAEMSRMDSSDFTNVAAGFQDVARAAWDSSLPLVCASRGRVIGGGFEVALVCDVIVCSDTTQFWIPDSELGFTATGGMTWLLPRVVGHGRAMDLLLTGRKLAAEEAHSWGLVAKVVPDGELESASHDVAERLAGFSGAGRNRRLLLDHGDVSFSAALAAEERADNDSFARRETREKIEALSTPREP